MAMEKEQQQWWKKRFSFKNATIAVCLFNLITAIILLQGFLSAASNRKFYPNYANSVNLRYKKESEELRRSMEPVELIKRVREIEQEGRLEQGIVQQQKDTKQTAAVDVMMRLNNFRSYSDNDSLKALEEWRKRKMERARQRMGKNATTAS
ncbi:uncharacterized protein LOC124940229 [Impatiens glandulifera]|uniref:uncharacterized protein LOC124940229 n=1 Tax=Impatiens glandulifera TaxID=253017 RepID=UPI001FB15A8C|nr:uncharacterized protein LOC124940229 [Impatiens glandulifera]